MKVTTLTQSNSIELFQQTFDNSLLQYFSIKSIHDSLNQDGVIYVYQNTRLVSVFVVDGMGGHQGGEKATELVAQTCQEFANKFNANDLRITILDVLETSDQKIKNLKIGAGATIAAVEIGEDYVRFYNAGDAFGLLLGARGKFKFKTIEHSPLGFGIEAGIVKRDDQTVESNIVSNGLGFEPMRIEISQKMEVKNNDLVLLSSDGILNNYQVDELINEMIEGDFNGRMERLINKITKDADKFLVDDTSIALIKINPKIV